MHFVDFSYGINATTVLIMIVSIILTVLSSTLGLYKFNKQEEKHVILDNKPDANRKCFDCKNQCGCGVWVSFCILIVIASLLIIVIILFLIPLWLFLLFKLSFNREYISYELYSKLCCKQIFKMDKVIVIIPNYCEIEHGDIHYHLNVGYHPKMNDTQYIYVGKYNNNDYYSYQVTEAVFWKIDDKSVSNVRRCSNIRLVIMLSLALISFALLWISIEETGFVNFHVYVYGCFGIGVLESLCVSWLARCCVVIEVFAIMIQFYLFPYIETHDRSDALFDGQCVSTYEFEIFGWLLVLRVFFYYGATLAMSNKESKKIAFLMTIMLISQMASMLDLMTDLTVVYVWIIFKNYYWSLFQCLILLTSQFIQIYFIIKKYEMYSKIFDKQQWQNVSNKQLKSNSRQTRRAQSI